VLFSHWITSLRSKDENLFNRRDHGENLKKQKFFKANRRDSLTTVEKTKILKANRLVNL
jgi:hypothetical protein